MAVTLAEIAALAGVSRGTVDRALNDRGRVDPKVAARVRRIAAERGYRPNRAGRMLARAKNPIRIGVIVQSVETMFMHTVFEEIERASAHFTTTGAEVLVRPLEGVDAQQQLDVIDELLEAGVQGIALSPAEDERVRARIQELSERMPVVTFNSDLPDSGRLCYVGVDNFACGRMSAGLMDLLLAGLAYKACPKLPVAYVGEVFGTGILGGLASYPIAAFVMGNTKAALFTFVPSFLVSTAVGAAISVLVPSALKRTHVLSALEGAKH